MPVDTDAALAARDALASIPFGNLIGGPLVAAVEAQGQAARSTVEFIDSVGFDIDADGKTKTVRNVLFKYTSGQQEIELTVPLLSIVPIPFIRIESMNINFKAKISAESNTSVEEKSQQGVEVKASVGVEFWKVKAQFDASYSSKKDSTATAGSKYAVEYTMDVSVHAVQDDLPAGLARILNLLTDSIKQPPPPPPAAGTQPTQSGGHTVN